MFGNKDGKYLKLHHPHLQSLTPAIRHILWKSRWFCMLKGTFKLKYQLHLNCDMSVLTITKKCCYLTGNRTDWNPNVTNTCRWFLSTPSCRTPASLMWWWSPAASWRSPTTPASSWRRTAPWSRRWTAATTRPRQPVPRTNRSPPGWRRWGELSRFGSNKQTNDLFLASDPVDKDFLAVFYGARAKMRSVFV